MELSTQHLRGPIQELTALSPGEWGMQDAGHARENKDDKSGGVFRFEIVARPATEVYKKYRKRLAKKSTQMVAEYQVKNAKALASIMAKDVDRTPAQRQAETQAGYDAALSLLVSMAQVFSDGDRAEIEGDELRELFTAPGEDQHVAWLDTASAGLEGELDTELFKPLEKNGESLADALARLIVSTSGKAERHRAEADKKEVADPLSSQSGSGRGSEEGKTPTLSAVAS